MIWQQYFAYVKNSVWSELGKSRQNPGRIPQGSEEHEHALYQDTNASSAKGKGASASWILSGIGESWPWELQTTGENFHQSRNKNSSGEL